MTDLQSTLDAIDAAIGCQQCGVPLAGSPSDDFCSELHQQMWHAERVGAEPDLGVPAWAVSSAIVMEEEPVSYRNPFLVGTSPLVHVGQTFSLSEAAFRRFYDQWIEARLMPPTPMSFVHVTGV